MEPVPVTRSEVRLSPDPTRVILRAFFPGGPDPDDERTHPQRVVDRVLAMSPEEASRTLADVRTRFAGRHVNLDEAFRRRFEVITDRIDDPGALSSERRELLGAYFSHEYAFETAALTNPSIVPAPDQTGVRDGSLRVIVSLRAIGEGHVSSIEFRSGLVHRDGTVEIDPAEPAVHAARASPVFDRTLFVSKLQELGELGGHASEVMGHVDEQFTMAQLGAALAAAREIAASSADFAHAERTIHWLAASNYRLTFPAGSSVAQRVLFPAGPAESRGMEDARFVRFVGPDEAPVYYATYTAYDGHKFLPQFIVTENFEAFQVATLHGLAVRNKGLALFPRQVGGRFTALARLDNENTYLIRSDHVRLWHDRQRIRIPTQPWELIKIGNCGSPIETDAGWLVITHGVGPMRTYGLGALLLDLEDPSRVLGALRDPLLLPEEDERDGYVPNVVYSCGSLVHGDRLVLAYGASDTTSRFATLPIDALLTELTSSRSRPSGV